MQLTCVVDDRVPQGSSLQAEHGISFVVNTGDHQVLFDTGQSSAVLLSNLAGLGFAPAQFDALILSHAHNDHMGGLPGLLEGVSGIPLYAHPDLFRGRYSNKDGEYKKVGPMAQRAWLEERLDVRLSPEPAEVVPGVWTSGGIAQRTEPEGGSPYHQVRQAAGWRPDPYNDDLSLVLETREGLVLVCGCCHAGLLNVLAQVRFAFGADPAVIVGGIHLAHASEPLLSHVVEELRGYGPPRMWLGHCTGDRAQQVMGQAFGSDIQLCQAGTILRF
jgi:7,8-dihydropterin-6-yl-methyl-4-(beta-D-ribofuranosyl)aminobenzene 5'-phosphate synthase